MATRREADDPLEGDPEMATLLGDVTRGDDDRAAMDRAVAAGWVPGDAATAATCAAMAAAGIGIVEGRMFMHRPSGKPYLLVTRDGVSDFVEPTVAMATRAYEEVRDAVLASVKAGFRVSLAMHRDEDPDPADLAARGDLSHVMAQSLRRDVVGLMLGGPPEEAIDPEFERLSTEAMQASFRRLSETLGGDAEVERLLGRRDA